MLRYLRVRLGRTPRCPGRHQGEEGRAGALQRCTGGDVGAQPRREPGGKEGGQEPPPRPGPSNLSGLTQGGSRRGSALPARRRATTFQSVIPRRLKRTNALRVQGSEGRTGPHSKGRWARVRRHTYTDTHTDTCAHTHGHTCTHMDRHTCILGHTQTHAHMDTLIHTHGHTQQTHTDTLRYSHTNTQLTLHKCLTGAHGRPRQCSLGWFQDRTDRTWKGRRPGAERAPEPSQVCGRSRLPTPSTLSLSHPRVRVCECVCV